MPPLNRRTNFCASNSSRAVISTLRPLCLSRARGSSPLLPSRSWLASCTFSRARVAGENLHAVNSRTLPNFTGSSCKIGSEIPVWTATVPFFDAFLFNQRPSSKTISNPFRKFEAWRKVDYNSWQVCVCVCVCNWTIVPQRVKCYFKFLCNIKDVRALRTCSESKNYLREIFYLGKWWFSLNAFYHLHVSFAIFRVYGLLLYKYSVFGTENEEMCKVTNDEWGETVIYLLLSRYK